MKPTMGVSLKDLVEYIDQQIKTKQHKASLTPGEYDALGMFRYLETWQKLIQEVYDDDDDDGPIGTNWREEFKNLADQILGYGKEGK